MKLYVEITVPEDYQVALKFQSFEVENHDTCMYDFVEIRDGDSADSKLIGVFCGYKVPPDIRASGNKLFVKFVSDGSVQKAGFSATYMKEIDECEVLEHGFVSVVMKCETVVAGTDKDCVWHFTTTPGHRIRLIFSNFEVEPHQECAYDHIAIYDGDNPDSSTLGRFCGSKTPHPISSTSNELLLLFKSDSSVQRKGFVARHSTACGGHLQATNKVKHFYSHSRFGDNDYDNRADCDWTIEAEPGKNVQLTFLTFELENEEACSYDFVEVYGGMDDTSGPLYGTYCGNLGITATYEAENPLNTMLSSGVLIDAIDSSDETESLLLHRKIAPHQLAVFCCPADQGNLPDLQDLARLVTIGTRKVGISTLNLPKCSTIRQDEFFREISRMDQLGVPYSVILNDESLRSGLLKLRSRDTTLSETIHLTDIPRYLLKIYSSF
uniref:CUB domain-containing protein n=1 Tax=Phlebotomus papatasi TaxID=29031 RepID=A0A1B0DKZ1_PHLPP